MHEQSTTAALVAEARSLAHRADSIALPTPQLDGWSSLCAHEYAVAIHRLDELRREVQATLQSMTRALQAG